MDTDFQVVTRCPDFSTETLCFHGSFPLTKPAIPFAERLNKTRHSFSKGLNKTRHSSYK